MTTITAAQVKELRDMTGAPMGDCNKALKETGGNIDEAIKWLRTKGAAVALKKAGNLASEGLVALITNPNLLSGAVVEVNSQTDFVARNEDFQKLVAGILEVALVKGGDVEQIKAAQYPGKDHNVAEEIIHKIGIIGENIQLRRSASLSVASGVIVSYVHNAIIPGQGKIAVLVAIESTGDKNKLQAFGKQIAMHIAASKPEALDRESVSEELIAREREIFREQSRASGKPDNIIEKMIDGRMRKFFEEVVLVEQIFAIDGKTKIADLTNELAKELGTSVKISGFIRYQLGEGIEKPVSNFAEEVAAYAKK